MPGEASTASEIEGSSEAERDRSAEWKVITLPTLENDQSLSEAGEASRHFAHGMTPAENSPRKLVTELLAYQRSLALPEFTFRSSS